MKHVVQESLAKNAALNVALHERNRVSINSNQLYRKTKQFLMQRLHELRRGSHFRSRDIGNDRGVPPLSEVFHQRFGPNLELRVKAATDYRRVNVDAQFFHMGSLAP